MWSGGDVPRAALATVLALTVVAALAACASAVSVAEAPYGDDPDCARVVLALPDELGDMPVLPTTSQASTAWGTATVHVILRCGVEPPGPTTDRCVSVETPGGPSTDWLAVPGESREDGAADWTFTTYGRDPAIEVVVPAEIVSVRSTSFLDQLGPAVALLDAERSCLGLDG